MARTAPPGTILLVNLSGRGDKDVQSVVEGLLHSSEERARAGEPAR
jgi:tryptophan synthase beta subunit